MISLNDFLKCIDYNIDVYIRFEKNTKLAVSLEYFQIRHSNWKSYFVYNVTCDNNDIIITLCKAHLSLT